MLREAKDATWVREGWLRPRHHLRLGRTTHRLGLSTGSRRRLLAAQRAAPVLVFEERAGGRRHWLAEDRVWSEDEGLTARDVAALLAERRLRARQRLERAHAVAAVQAAGSRPRRAPIPRAVRQAVWERDGGACTVCGAAFDLQFDHVIPVALGGGGTAANLQLLCGPCNREKGAALG